MWGVGCRVQVGPKILMVNMLLSDPCGRDGKPVRILFADVYNARSADGGRRGLGQVSHLEHDYDVGRHGNAVAIGQLEDTVVIEDGVEVLNPDRVHRPVRNDPRNELVRPLVVHL